MIGPKNAYRKKESSSSSRSCLALGIQGHYGYAQQRLSAKEAFFMSIKARAGQTKSLNSLINKDTSVLGALINRATQLKQIETHLKALLPDALRDEFRVADWQQQRLIIMASQATLLTYFRFAEPQIRQQLQQHYPELERIELKIRPRPPQPKTIPTKKIQLSNNTRTQLLALAEKEQHPDLKAALIILANSHQI
ncbi:DciA family protein [Marinospirillum sp. MEB164]|uniref:DciA family protein n=1 Tax=Marinospirillum alkalitolerans TaxID=3123374 RepID=A0ABW8PXB5_9GAMM